MLKIDFTKEMIFGFDGPNLCLLGTPDDFKNLGKAIIGLTTPNASDSVEITNLDFAELAGNKVKVIFASKPGACLLGKIADSELLVFELDDRYWERIFVFFALMSWDKKTYYLNSFEDPLRDLPIEQECHFICSSEF